MKMKRDDAVEALKTPWAWFLSECVRHNWPSAYVAEQTGVSRSTVRALYNGRNKAPTLDVMNKLLAFAVDHYGDEPLKGVAGKLPRAA